MGVRGLTTFIAKARKECSIRHEDLQSMTLGVDMDAFLNYVCGELVQQHPPSWFLLGGDPRELYLYVQDWIQLMQDRMIKIKFIRDPPGIFTTQKNRIRQERSLQKSVKLNTIEEKAVIVPVSKLSKQNQNAEEVNFMLNDEVASEMVNSISSVFPLAYETMVQCIREMKCPLETASIEADEFLGSLVRTNKVYAVVSLDSDFLCMKNVKYIPLNEVQCDFVNKTIKANIYDSNLVAKYLNISPSRLIELAILSGNDFTVELDESFQFGAKLHFPIARLQRTYHSPVDSVNWLKHHYGHLMLLDDPILKEIQVQEPHCMQLLYEMYCFYGFEKEFLQKFPGKQKLQSHSTLNLLKMIKLVDNYRYPKYAIDILLTNTRYLHQRIDPFKFKEIKLLPYFKTANLRSMDDVSIQSRKLLYKLIGCSKIVEIYRDSEMCMQSVHYALTKGEKASNRSISSSALTLSKPKRENQFELAMYGLLGIDLQSLENNRNFPRNNAILLFSCPKPHPEMNIIMYTVLQLLQSPLLHFMSLAILDALLLTSIICHFIEGHRTEVSAFSRKELERIQYNIHYNLLTTCVGYIDILKNTLHIRYILHLDTSVDPHRFFAAPLFLQVYNEIMNITKADNKTLTKKQVMAILNQVLLQFNGLQFASSGSWKYWTYLQTIKHCHTLYSKAIMIPFNASTSTIATASATSTITTSTATGTTTTTTKVTEKLTKPKKVKVKKTKAANSEVIEPPCAADDLTVEFHEKLSVQGEAMQQSSNTKLDIVKRLMPSSVLTKKEYIVKLYHNSRAINKDSNSSAQVDHVKMLMPVSVLTNKKNLELVDKHIANAVESANDAAKKKLKQKMKNNKTSDTDSNMSERSIALDTPEESESKKRVKLTELIYTLPVYQHHDEIISSVKRNQLTIIQGETGCGKSTSVAQFIYDDCAQNEAEKPANIFVLQPRRVAAISLANTVAKMRDENIGRTVGYRIGQARVDSKSTRITFVTTGYMLEKLLHEYETMSQISHLILDEAHERSMAMDMILLLLKMFFVKGLVGDLKVIIMSATMDSSIFYDYFKPVLRKGHSKKALFVGSQLHPVKQIFLDTLVNELSLANSSNDTSGANSVANKVKQVVTNMVKLEETPSLAKSSNASQNILANLLDIAYGIADSIIAKYFTNCSRQCADNIVTPSILIFLSGINEINTLHELFTGHPYFHYLRLFVLHSELEIKDQEQAFILTPKFPKIILSTNIAESSVTIPDVTHVINLGLEKIIVLQESNGHAETLVRAWCSKASVKQRTGRAGRVIPGTAFHLFTCSFMEKCMDNYTTPEILRIPLDKVVLTLRAKMSHFGTPLQLLQYSMSVPDLNQVQNAFQLLYDMYAMCGDVGSGSSGKEDDNSVYDLLEITPFGHFACHLPFDISISRFLMYGLSMPALDGVLDFVIIACIVSMPSLYVNPSRFHIKSSLKYMEAMKLNLNCKLKVDQRQYSECLGLWQFYIQLIRSCSDGLMKFSKQHWKQQYEAMVRNHDLSFTRVHALNNLIEDVCSRLLSLNKSTVRNQLQLLSNHGSSMHHVNSANNSGSSHGSSYGIHSPLPFSLTPNTVSALESLKCFSATSYLPDFWTFKHLPFEMGQFFLVFNYHTQILRGNIEKPIRKVNVDAVQNQLKKSRGSNTAANINAQAKSHYVSMELDSKSKWFSSKMQSNETALSELLNPLCNETNMKLVSNVLQGNDLILEFKEEVDSSSESATLSTSNTEQPGAPTGLEQVLYPLSLLHYLRDRKFPIDFEYTSATSGDDDNEKRISGGATTSANTATGNTQGCSNVDVRFRVSNEGIINSNIIKWRTVPEGKNAALTSRNILTLPFYRQEEDEKNEVYLMYTSRLYVGDVAFLNCSQCTLLPQQNPTFYPLIAILSSQSPIWLYMDEDQTQIGGIKLPGQTLVFSKGSSLTYDTMRLINAIRINFIQYFTTALTMNRMTPASAQLSKLSRDDIKSLLQVQVNPKISNGKKWDWVQRTLQVVDSDSNSTTSAGEISKKKKEQEPTSQMFAPFIL